MGKYFVYHCSVSTIDSDTAEVSPVLEAHTDDSRLSESKDAALTELRDIIDAHCTNPLHAEIARLNRVVGALELHLKNAHPVSV